MKLQVKALKKHTLLHFSIAQLSRVQHTQDVIQSNYHRRIPKLVHRRIEPPPEHPNGSLRVAIDVLFKPDAPRHLRGKDHQQVSEFIQDLLYMADMVNGGLLDEFWIHYCWDKRRKRACCASDADCISKTTVAVANGLHGRSDPVPAESRCYTV